MSQRSSDENPSPDLYVGLLFVAVAALIAGSVLVYFELGSYAGKLP